jgi:hypothetical protein
MSDANKSTTFCVDRCAVRVASVGVGVGAGDGDCDCGGALEGRMWVFVEEEKSNRPALQLGRRFDSPFLFSFLDLL